MAYCIGSLVETLEQILYPDKYHRNWVLDPVKEPQIQSLLENATSLINFLTNSTPAVQARIESLEDQIRCAAENAEDVLETHISDQILSTRSDQSLTLSPPDLLEVIQQFESANGEIMRIMSCKLDKRPTPLIEQPAIHGRRLTSKDTLVGLTKDVGQVKDLLRGRSNAREIIPIVGMGGIGKTTLARRIYDDYLFDKSHFDICAWTTVSQIHNLRDIILPLLYNINGKRTDEMLRMKEKLLGLYLHQSLIGRRYLVFLDDIWSTDAWDDVQMFFPDDKIGSRIILTTRESDVANYVDSKSSRHQMCLLGEVDSWRLLREKVYGKQSCPWEFEKIGKRIASNCGGLPLAIEVVGGLLSQVEKSNNSWEYVDQNISSFMPNKNDQVSRIFSLSYDHLPHYLKPCFVYMGAFPENCKIPASKLTRLWVAEGFLKPIGDKSLEEVGGVYLKALVDRNLIFVRERKFNGEVKSYGIHDLLRDLCLRKATHKKFLYVHNGQMDNRLEKKVSGLRRVSVHPSYCIGDVLAHAKLMSHTRSFLCTGRESSYILSPVIFASRFLRTLDILEIKFHQFPRELLQLVNLRYLAFYICSALKDISRLQNLQTLLVQSDFKSGNSASEVFDIAQLRHITFLGAYPTFFFESDTSDVLQENLQTLCNIEVYDLMQVLARFPNINNLGIFCSRRAKCTVNLTCLLNLKILKFSSKNYPSSRTVLSNLTFPPSLQKLTLQQCIVPQACLKVIGMLPNLEILKIQDSTMDGLTWELSEDGFGQLKFLHIELLNLVHWLFDDTNFPHLQKLVIRCCTVLNEIPSNIGEIPTLEMIEADECSPSAVTSVRKIQVEQAGYANTLQIRINGSSI